MTKRIYLILLSLLVVAFGAGVVIANTLSRSETLAVPSIELADCANGESPVVWVYPLGSGSTTNLRASGYDAPPKPGPDADPSTIWHYNIWLTWLERTDYVFCNQPDPYVAGLHQCVIYVYGFDGDSASRTYPPGIFSCDLSGN